MSWIELKDVTKSYQTALGKITPVNHLSFRFPENGLISIIGESGSGKSTLLSLLAGYLTPDSGRIERSCNLSQVGFVFQSLCLVDHLNALENAALPLIIKGSSYLEGIKRGEACLQQVGLTGLGKRKSAELSGGQKARVSLARGLALDCPIILADEPTGSLDSANARQVMETFKKLSQDRLIVIVTHNEELAMEYSSGVYKITGGKLIEVKKETKPKKAYQGKREAKFGHLRLTENIRLSFSFLKSRLKTVLPSLLFASICFGLIMALLSLGPGGQKELAKLSKDYFDYTCPYLQEKRTYEIPGQKINLIKKVRLSEEEETYLKKKDSSLGFYPSLDYFLPVFQEAKLEGSYLEGGIYLTPSFPSQERLMEGKLPASYDQIVINQGLVKKDSRLKVGSVLAVQNDVKVTTNYLSTNVDDVIHLAFNFEVVGISCEKDLLSRPTAYYDYLKMHDHLFSLPLKEASERFSTLIDIQGRLGYLSSDDDPATSFKTLAFATDPAWLRQEAEQDPDKLSCTSLALEVAASFEQIVDSFSKIALIFVGLSLACSFLLEQVVIENLYRDKRKELAICLSFHLGKGDFIRLGLGQALILAFFLLLFSAFFALLSFKGGNMLLAKYGLEEFLTLSSLGSKWLLMPILALLFSLISGLIPLFQLWKTDLVSSLVDEEQ